MHAPTAAPLTATPDVRFWDRTARAYAESPVADPEGYARTLDRLLGLIAPRDAVLELGCGTGTTALRLAPHAAALVATDLSEAMIAIAREKQAADPCPTLRFEVASAETIRAPSGGYDVVLGLNLLHLLPDLDAALRHIHALVRPGGLFLSKTACIRELNPLLRWAIPLMVRLGKAPQHVRVFDEPTLVRAITAAGFRVEAVERHGVKRGDIRPFIVARRP